MNSRWQYYKRLVALYRSYRRRQAIVPVPPLRLWLEISSRCNLRCGACPNKDLPGNQKGDMEWPLFKNVVDQASEFAFEINLHHRGESLLHPEAGRFIRYAGATGVSCRLHTNATLLRGKLSDEILGSGLQRLSVSFDGFNAAAYEANRLGASFAEVSGNVADFLERRRRLKQRHPRVTIEAMALPPVKDNARRR
ncbi:MAG: radical SAM protein, partial [Acidobacteria bacterium]|nr:radical SAM protein [Acidobacteriota bacterium]